MKSLRMILLCLACLSVRGWAGDLFDHELNRQDLFDGVRLKMWPVWARPGNEHVLSRKRYWGENFS